MNEISLNLNSLGSVEGVEKMFCNAVHSQKPPVPGELHSNYKQSVNKTKIWKDKFGVKFVKLNRLKYCIVLEPPRSVLKLHFLNQI